MITIYIYLKLILFRKKVDGGTWLKEAHTEWIATRYYVNGCSLIQFVRFMQFVRLMVSDAGEHFNHLN